MCSISSGWEGPSAGSFRRPRPPAPTPRCAAQWGGGGGGFVQALAGWRVWAGVGGGGAPGVRAPPPPPPRCALVLRKGDVEECARAPPSFASFSAHLVVHLGERREWLPARCLGGNPEWGRVSGERESAFYNGAARLLETLRVFRLLQRGEAGGMDLCARARPGPLRKSLRLHTLLDTQRLYEERGRNPMRIVQR